MKLIISIILSLGIIVMSILILMGFSFVSAVIFSDDPILARKVIINDLFKKFAQMFMIINFIYIVIYFLIIIGFIFIKRQDENIKIIIILSIIFLIPLIIFTIGMSYIYKFIIENNDEIINSINNKNLMKLSIICLYISLSCLPVIFSIYKKINY